MDFRNFTVLLMLPFAALAQQEAKQMQPIASHGGTATVSAPRPLDEHADQLNQSVAAETTDGLVVGITIDGSSISLDSAIPAPAAPISPSRAGRA